MPGPENRETMNKWAVLGTVMLAVFMSVLDGSIVTIALPKMMEVFSVETDRIRMVIELYAISFAIATLTVSWLRGKFGIKRTFISGLLLFTVTSFLCGRAWDINSIVAFRILQGIGGGIMLPSGMTIVTERFPPNERGKAFGIFGIVIVFAPTIGPMLGGYLVDYIDWRYIFYINIPIGAIEFVISYKVLKELKEHISGRFDAVGFVGLSVAVSCMLVGLSHGQRVGWNTTYIVSLFVTAFIGFCIFLYSGLRISNPIIKLSLFKNFHFSIISFLNLMRSSALFARIFLVPLFFQTVAGMSAVTTGLIVTVGAIAAGITTPITGFFVDRIGPRPFIFTGFSIMAVSNFAYYTLNIHSSNAAIIVPMILFGIGAGMLNSPIVSSSMNIVKRDEVGQVSTITTITLEIGAALGVALVGTAVTIRTAFHHEAVPAFQDAFLYTGIFCLFGLIPALGLLNMKSFHGKAKAESKD